MALVLINRRRTVTPDAVITGAEIRRLGDVRTGTVVARSRVGRFVGPGPHQAKDNQSKERRPSMPATYRAGEDQIPPGTFHGEDKIPPGTFH